MSEDDIWLMDPFNQTQDLTEEITENYTVRKYAKLGSNWYGVQLKSPPGYKLLSSYSIHIRVIRTSDSMELTEVSKTTFPSSNQFRVDYDNVNPVTKAVLTDYKSTGLIQFNATDLGEEVQITYWSTGKGVIPQNFTDYLADMVIPGNLTVADNLQVGDTGTDGSLSVIDSVDVGVDLDVGRDATIGNDLTLGGEITAAGGLLSVAVNLTVSGDADINGDITCDTVEALNGVGSPSVLAAGCGLYGESSTQHGVVGYTNTSSMFGVYGGCGSSGYSGVYGYGGGSQTGVYGKSLSGNGVTGNGPPGAYDFYASGPGTNYGPFTGGHELTLEESINVEKGMILSVEYTRQRSIENSEEISLSTTFPHCKLAGENDSPHSVFASFSTPGDEFWCPIPDDMKYAIGNALGEGWLLATDRDGIPKKGDILITGKQAGFAHRLDPDTPITAKILSRIIGKVIADSDWKKAEKIGKTKYKKLLIPVIYQTG